VKEYMEVPLADDGVYGDWKRMDENAQSEPKPPPSPLPLPLPKRKAEEVKAGPPVKRRAMSEPPLSTSQPPSQRTSSQPPQNHQPHPNHVLLLEIDTLRQTLADARSSALPDFVISRGTDHILMPEKDTVREKVWITVNGGV
jgi:hypothetical protein